jgi:hypothetical protein
MRIHPKDVVSFAGRDYIVEGTATYHLGGKSFLLARAVDGEIVFWIEALRDEADDRLLVLREIRDLEMYVQRLSGRATIEIAGRVPERAAGSADVWRYRAAGDLFLQIEEGGGRVFMLAGESVHRGMIDVLPGR